LPCYLLACKETLHAPCQAHQDPGSEHSWPYPQLFIPTPPRTKKGSAPQTYSLPLMTSPSSTSNSWSPENQREVGWEVPRIFQSWGCGWGQNSAHCHARRAPLCHSTEDEAFRLGVGGRKGWNRKDSGGEKKWQACSVHPQNDNGVLPSPTLSILFHSRG
jgi:hypothetical protein